MSVEIIKKKVFRCTCEWVDCKHVWETTELPKRCAKCKRFSWNGTDNRTKDGASLNVVARPEPKKRAKKAS